MKRLLLILAILAQIGCGKDQSAEIKELQQAVRTNTESIAMNGESISNLVDSIRPLHGMEEKIMGSTSPHLWDMKLNN